MTSERLNELQAAVANANQQIAAAVAARDKLQGQLEECMISAGFMALAGAFTGWLNPPPVVIEVPDA